MTDARQSTSCRGVSTVGISGGTRWQARRTSPSRPGNSRSRPRGSLDQGVVNGLVGFRYGSFSSAGDCLVWAETPFSQLGFAISAGNMEETINLP